MPTVARINLEPDKPTLDGRQLEQLIELWMEDCRRKVKPRTMENKRYMVRWMLNWWSEYGPSADWLIDEYALIDFSHYLEDTPTARSELMSWHMRNAILYQLRQVFRWAHKCNYVPLDFARFVPHVKGKPPTRKPVTIETLAVLMEEAGRSSRYHVRDQAMIATLAGTGIRCIECANLIIADVTMKSDLTGFLRLRITKGDRPRIVAFDQYAGAYLSAWLDECAGLLPDTPLFATQSGSPFMPASIYMHIRMISKRAGIRDQISGPHDLRRLFATHWSRQRPGEGYGHLLQKQLGHSEFSMTTQYLLHDAEDVLCVMRSEAVSPMAALNHRNTSLPPRTSVRIA